MAILSGCWWFLNRYLVDRVTSYVSNILGDKEGCPKSLMGISINLSVNIRLTKVVTLCPPRTNIKLIPPEQIGLEKCMPCQNFSCSFLHALALETSSHLVRIVFTLPIDQPEANNKYVLWLWFFRFQFCRNYFTQFNDSKKVLHLFGAFWFTHTSQWSSVRNIIWKTHIR